MADVLVKTNLTATVAPTVTNDTSEGYSVFSPWVDVVANRVYFAADVSPGAAVWREIAGGVSGAVLTLPQINDTSSDHQYVFAVNELVADRTVTLPLLTGNDTFVFEAHAQTLTNKTIVAANNSLTLFAGGANNQLLTDNGSGGLVSESGITFDGSLLDIDGNMRLGDGGGGATVNFNVNASGEGHFEVGGVRTLTLAANAKAGVNNPIPSAQLDITAEASTVGLNLDLNGTAGSALTVTDSGSNVLFVIDGTGQVGIGDSTSTPNALLDVRGAAGGPGIQELSTAETTVVDGDELGRINFRAPDDAAGGDANLVAAAIYAEADATFSSSVNNTELVFATGESETATEKMRLTADGKLGVGTATPARMLHVSGGGLSVERATDAILIFAKGGVEEMSLYLTSGGDLQIFDQDVGPTVTFKQTGNVGFGNQAPTAKVDIAVPALTVGVNIDLASTPGSAVTVTNQSSVIVFAVESDGGTTTELDSVFNTTEGGTARLTRQTGHEAHTLANAATSDTTTISIPSGARLLAVSFNVNTAVIDDGGDDTWSAAFVTGSTTTLATAAAAAQDTKVDLMLPDEISAGVCQIRFTANGGSFTAGVIEIVCYFESLTSLANV